MATVGGLSDRQRQRFQALREGGQGNRARQFKKRALAKNQAAGQTSDNTTGAGADSGILFGDGNVNIGAGVARPLAKGAAIGQELIDHFLPDISVLGTLDPTRSNEIQNLINRQQAFADQSGQRSGALQGLLDSLQGRAATAGDRTASAHEALGLARQGLGGLTAQENDALRARGFEGINRGFLGGQRALARAQGRSGVQGAAASAQMRDLNRDLLGSTQGLERDIMLENINIQDERRNRLQDLLQGFDRDEFDRGQRANELFGRTLGDTEGREFDQQRLAFTDLRNITEAARLNEQQRQEFNIQQNANLLAGQTGLFFGGMGVFDAARTANQNQKAQEQNQAAAIANANAIAQASQNAAGQIGGILGGANFPALF